jgi:O-antigen biosynthesis protein
MTSHRRMPFTGERAIPGDTESAGVFAEHLARYRFAQPFARKRHVLDAACGVGYGTALLAEAGADAVVGVDIDGPSISYARQTYGQTPGVQFIRADLETLADAVRERFDLCVSFETIEHLNEPERFLQNLRMILAPDGVLLISTPNRYLYSPLNKDGRHSHNPFHRKEWTQHQFVSLLSCYFEITAVYGQVFWSTRQALLFHWKERAKRALPGVSSAIAWHRTLRGWFTRHHSVLQSGLSKSDRSMDPDKEEQRVRVRPFAADMVPMYLVCLCRNRPLP